MGVTMHVQLALHMCLCAACSTYHSASFGDCTVCYVCMHACMCLRVLGSPRWSYKRVRCVLCMCVVHVCCACVLCAVYPHTQYAHHHAYLSLVIIVFREHVCVYVCVLCAP